MTNFNKKFIPDEIKYVIKKIMDNGGQSYIVGGAIRSLLLSREVNDWDIASSFTPNAIMNIFSNHTIIKSGIKYGTITVIINYIHIQITTFRGEKNYYNFRHPDSIKFISNIENDLARRDFTINAIAFNPLMDKHIIDPFNGMLDLSNKLIKTVGNPQQRFYEDPLRIIRGIRFASQLGFKIDNNTWDSIIHLSYLVEKLSKERIREEFNKIILGDFAPLGLSLLFNSGILHNLLDDEKYILSYGGPGYNKMYNILPKIDKRISLRLTAFFIILLYQNSNNMELSLTSDNKDSYIQFVIKSIRSLKYDNKTLKHCLDLLDCYILITSSQNNANYTVKKALNKLQKDDLFIIIYIWEIIIPYLHCFNSSELYTRIKHIKNTAKRIVSRNEPISLFDLDINGSDVASVGIGISDKKEIGAVLNMALEWVWEDPLLNKRTLLLNKIKKYKEKDST